MNYPRFDEYKPGTILEIIVKVTNNQKPFLILITNDTPHDGAKFRKKEVDIIAVWIDTGGFIMKDYKWSIIYQEVKKGGLRDDNTE